jgi:superfamily II DNA/RNA helicase
MPRGRSTFTKRQKEQTRQQRQREKAERRNQRKQEKGESTVDEMSELRAHAEAQAALFNVGFEETSPVELSSADDTEGTHQ